MPQFLIPPGKQPDDRVALSPEESHHAARVLRLERGAHVRLTDGAGALFTGRIETITPKQTIVWIEAKLPDTNLQSQIMLAQGLLKGEKMEFVIQKAAELGAHTLIPFTSSRTVAEWKGEAKKLERWRKIAEAASKQCGRATHLQVREPLPFKKLLEEGADAKILFWEEERNAPGMASRRGAWPSAPTERILLVIGPEGGFSQQEVEEAKSQHCLVLTLGSLTLRAETAAVTVLSILQYELGTI